MANSAVGAVRTIDLTHTQKEKYAYLSPVYGDSAATLVTLFSSKGENSFSSIQEKLRIILKANYEDRSYYEALYESIELDKTYTSSEIIGIVADVRRDLNLTPYDKRIKIQCERDFRLLFVFTEVYETFTIDEVERRQLKGLQPLFSIKPD